MCLAEAWVEHLQNIQLRVDDTSMTVQERTISTAMTMEPINEIDETILDDTSVSSVDRDQSDSIKVKKVCKCL